MAGTEQSRSPETASALREEDLSIEELLARLAASETGRLSAIARAEQAEQTVAVVQERAEAEVTAARTEAAASQAQAQEERATRHAAQVQAQAAEARAQRDLARARAAECKALLKDLAGKTFVATNAEVLTTCVDDDLAALAPLVLEPTAVFTASMAAVCERLDETLAERYSGAVNRTHEYSSSSSRVTAEPSRFDFSNFRLMVGDRVDVYGLPLHPEQTAARALAAAGFPLARHVGLLAFYRRIVQLAGDELGIDVKEAGTQVLVFRWLEALAAELSAFLGLAEPLLVGVNTIRGLPFRAPRPPRKAYKGGTDLRISLSGRWLAIFELKAWAELEGGVFAEKDQALIEGAAYWHGRESAINVDDPPELAQLVDVALPTEGAAAAATAAATEQGDDDEAGQPLDCTSDNEAGSVDAGATGGSSDPPAPVTVDTSRMMPACLFDLGRLNVSACFAVTEGGPSTAEPAHWTMGMSSRVLTGIEITEAVVGVLLYALSQVPDLPAKARAAVTSVVDEGAVRSRQLTLNRRRPAPTPPVKPVPEPTRVQPPRKGKSKAAVGDENEDPRTEFVPSSSSGAYIRAVFPDQQFEPTPCTKWALAELPVLAVPLTN